MRSVTQPGQRSAPITHAIVFLAILVALVYTFIQSRIRMHELSQSELAAADQRWNDLPRFPEYQKLLALPFELPHVNQYHYVGESDGRAELKHVRNHRPESIPMLEEFKADPDRKLVMTNVQFDQVFLAYADPKYPVFITSDSILNAYHASFERVLIDAERLNAALMRLQLGTLRERLDDVSFAGDTETITSAREIAWIVVSVPLVLMNPTLHEGAPSIVHEEVAAVRNATGERFPKWLGEPSSDSWAIDYGRFRPAGFYDRFIMLRRYFRAMRWLQSIPLQSDRDDQLIAAWMLASAAGDKWGETSKRLSELFGTDAQIDIRKLRELAGALPASTESLVELRRRLARYAKENDIGDPRDLVRMSDSGHPTIRVLSSVRPVEDVLFERDLRSPDVELGKLDVSLRLCAALGSSFAREQLSGETRNAIERQTAGMPDWPGTSNLHARYLSCLRFLVDEPPNDAPIFMRGELWQRKSCQAIASSWAQERNAGLLHVEESLYPMNGHEEPEIWGFVEPNPEFFDRLAQLAERTAKLTDFVESDRDRAILLVETVLRAPLENPGFVSEEERGSWFQSGGTAARLRYGFSRGDPSDFEEQLGRDTYTLACLVKLHHRLTTQDELDRELSKYVEKLVRGTEMDWGKFTKLCRRLGEIARKELRGETLANEDSEFIRDYGDQLAPFYGYSGVTGNLPLDDSFRCVIVCSNPYGEHLYAAAARPHALYVLYPYQGKEVLCRGAVMPYFEFVSNERLNDGKWKQLYDGDHRPETPEWVRPLVGRE